MLSYRIPNLITLLRILGIPVVVFLLYRSQEVPTYQIKALLLLILLQASDILDGYLARLVRQKTSLSNPFGQLMDPIADKLYINSTYITLSITHNFPIWLTALVGTRDVFIAGGWFIKALVTKERTIRPNIWGKACDSCQALLIFIFLLQIPFQFFNYGAVLTAALTVVSWIVYIWLEVKKYVSPKRIEKR